MQVWVSEESSRLIQKVEMTNNISTYSITCYVAGLLHDIGKFWQRADASITYSKSEELSSQTKNLDSSFCPAFNNRYTHQHVLWTSEFIQHFQCLWQEAGLHVPEGNSLERLAAAHHKPGNTWERIIQLADHYASGIDRSEPTEKDLQSLVNKESESYTFKTTALQSILSGSTIQDTVPSGTYTALPLEPLALNREALFPQANSSVDQAGFSKLWKEFVATFEGWCPRSPDALCEGLLLRLWVYTHAIPSSTIDLPNVSLYDHLKITGAFSASIVHFLMEEKKWDGISSWTISDKDEPLLLVGADLSGIQSFIYDVGSKQASKNLKGRSFYLQQLMQSVAKQFLREIELQSGHVLYASGGKFYLLAPNTESVRTRIVSFQNDLAQKLFEVHAASLYIGLDSVVLSHADLIGSRGRQEDARSSILTEKWRELGERLGDQKQRRFASLLSNKFEKFFQPIGQGGESPSDSITGEELGEKDVIIKDDNEDSKGVYSRATNDLIVLGRELRRYSYLGFGVKGDYNLAGSSRLSFLSDGKTGSSLTWQTVLNNPSEAVRVSTASAIPTSLSFYGGNDFPADPKGDPKTFEDLGGEGSLKRLGILRMDVDNLGLLFERGLRGRKTLSTLATLSRSLDTFFQGYLNTLWSTQEGSYTKAKFRDHTFIVYSGGDDLFIVGRWDVVLDFAETIQTELRAYAGGNPHITLSAGMAIVPPKYPIARAAQLAAAAEKAAKKHEHAKVQKASICLSGMELGFVSRSELGSENQLMPLAWDKEWLLVRAIASEMLDLLKQKTLPRSFLSHLKGFYVKSKQDQAFSWQWQLAYSWARMAEGDSEEKRRIRVYLKTQQSRILAGKNSGVVELQSSVYNYFDVYQYAARLTELLLRTHTPDESNTQNL